MNLILKEKSPISKMILLIIALALLVVLAKLSNENQQHKKEIGISYHYALEVALNSPYSDLQYLLQENETISPATLEIYATAFGHNFNSLQVYYDPLGKKMIELHNFTWQLQRKTVVLADTMRKEELQEVPQDQREELIAMLQAGNQTFLALTRAIEAKGGLFSNSHGTKWFNALHQPTEEVLDIIRGGLAPVTTD